MKRIEDFDKYLNNLRNNYNKFWSDRNEIQNIPTGRWDKPTSTHRSKRLRIDNMSDLESSYRRLYYEIIDSVKCRLNQRFADIGQLDFIALLESRRFPEFC